MRTEFTCLCCEGQYVRPDHNCPAGNLCRNGRHYDFCHRCGGKKGLIILNFEKQFQKLLPRLRLEGGST